MRSNNYHVQMVVSLTPMVKALLIANAAIWLFAVVFLQGFILKDFSIFSYFGLVPDLFLKKFFLWQPLSYMFLHSPSVWHLLFNSLIIWFVGSELEKIWGSKEFLKYYLVSGAGAGILYVFVAKLAVSFFGLSPDNLYVPTVGASGAVFGLLVAYGVIFGERIIYFMLLFPMKAKHFIGVLALVEIATLLTSGIGGTVNNTAHLGGFVVGAAYLQIRKYLYQNRQNRWLKKSGRKLKLVIDNESEENRKGPTYH